MARQRESKRTRRKVCKLCVERVKDIDYKDERRLQRFVTERGKIVPRRVSGNCSRHQAQVARAIKKARILALLPFTSEQYR